MSTKRVPRAKAAVAAAAAVAVIAAVAVAAAVIAAVGAAAVTAVNLRAVIDFINQYFERKAAMPGACAALLAIQLPIDSSV
jgi:hypothetical protein